MTQSFDFNKALAELQAGKGLTGEDGVLTPLIKQLTEAALKAELEQHLESETEVNRKNGSTKKTVKSSIGQFELETPRDRSGSFEPQFVKKNQTKLTPEIAQIIMRGGNSLEIAEVSLKAGYNNLRLSGIRKAAEGVTSLAEINRVTSF